MNNPFSIFYGETVDIVSIAEKGAYEKSHVKTPLASVRADIQPYRGTQPYGAAVQESEYGQRLDYQLRMFCDNCDAAAEGSFVRYNNKLYKIVYAAKWTRFGAELLLKEVEEHAED